MRSHKPDTFVSTKAANKTAHCRLLNMTRLCSGSMQSLRSKHAGAGVLPLALACLPACRTWWQVGYLSVLQWVGALRGVLLRTVLDKVRVRTAAGSSSSSMEWALRSATQCATQFT
jgi:hypothetical protein